MTRVAVTRRRAVYCMYNNQLGAAENLTDWYDECVDFAPVVDSPGPASVDEVADDDDRDAGLCRSFSDDVIAAAKPEHDQQKGNRG